MKKPSRRTIGVIFALILGITGTVTGLASATSAGVHGTLASGSQKVNCSTIHWQVTDVPRQGERTNWNSTNTCRLEQEALIKCEQRGHYLNFHGPWRTTERISEADCGSGYNIYCAAIKDRPVSGGAASQSWVWPNSDCDTSSPAKTLLAAQKRMDCTLNYASNVNDQFFPVWAETRSRTSTTCNGQQRTVILVCVRGVCGGGFYHGGWVLLSNHRTDSRATEPSNVRGTLDRAWFEDRGGSGQDVQCQEYFPVMKTSTFDCDPADQP